MAHSPDNADRFTICGVAELCDHQARGVTHVISILDPDSPDPPDLSRYADHARLDLRLHDIIEPTEGMVAPSVELIRAVVEFGAAFDASRDPDKHLLIHCQAGISR